MSGIHDYAPTFVCTPSSANNNITTAFGTPPNGTIVQFQTSGTFATPISANTDFYTFGRSTSTFNISQYNTNIDWRSFFREVVAAPGFTSTQRIYDYGTATGNSTHNTGTLINVAYIGYMLGRGISKQLGVIKIQQGSAQANPTTIDVEITNDDGKTWTLAQTFVNPPVTGSLFCFLALTTPVTAQGFRLMAKANNGSGGTSWSLTELIALEYDSEVPVQLDIGPGNVGIQTYTAPITFPNADSTQDFDLDMIEIGDQAEGSYYKAPPPANKIQDNYAYDDVIGTLVVSGGGGGGPFVG